MLPTLRYVTAMALSATASALAHTATAQTPTARDIKGPSPLVAITDEPAARLIVDPPMPEQLARGLVFIQYRAEHARIVPVFGAGALAVSPRVAHVHITVDDLPWHFVDASGETVILVGLPPGSHRVLFELADPTHRVITSLTVHFTVPVAAPPTVYVPNAPKDDGDGHTARPRPESPYAGSGRVRGNVDGTPP